MKLQRCVVIEKVAHRKQWESICPQTSLTQPCLTSVQRRYLTTHPSHTELYPCSIWDTLEVLSHSENSGNPARSQC